MTTARIDAKKVATAASATLKTLENDTSSSEQVRIKKEIMITRIHDLACAADQSGEKIVLTAEEFSLISKNWS